MSKIKHIFRGLVDLLYPPRCLSCGTPLGVSRMRICSQCRAEYDAERIEICPVCGETASVCRCGVDYLQRAGLSVVVSRFYDPKPSDTGCKMTHDLILRCKGTYSDALSDFLVRELAFQISELFRRNGEDTRQWQVTYPPRSPANLLKFGFDHGELLAESLARLLDVACTRTLFRYSGENQKELSPDERYANAESSLAPIRKNIIPGGKYILVDDIITTGATMAVAAELLYACGAEAVLPAAVAKTVISQGKSYAFDGGMAGKSFI